jgi:hypothetical protein
MGMDRDLWEPREAGSHRGSVSGRQIRPGLYDPTEPATAVLEPANAQGTFVQFVFGAGGLLMFWVFSKLGEAG